MTACYNVHAQSLKPRTKGLPLPYYEFTIHIADAYKEALVRKLSELGTLGMIEQRSAVIAYFPDTANIDNLARELCVIQALFDSSVQERISFNQILVPDQDWNATWQKSFKSINIGKRFAVLPPWEQPDDNRINLIVDPAMAFGTGHHETTRSCLLLMERLASRTAQERFLDIGTGTGILAIAAAKLGFEHVLGVDIDPLAVDAAIKNCMVNKTEQVEIRSGSVADVPGQFDFIAANLISLVLIKLAPDIAAHVAPSGIAVLSGMLTGQDEDVTAAMQAAGLELLEKRVDGKWVTTAVIRREHA
jgi:ribosomal protein L11 methyltransferase